MSWLFSVLLQWTLGYMCLFQLWFLQWICPVLEFMGHLIVLILVIFWFFFFFKKSPYSSPQLLHQFTSTPAIQEASLFSTTSPVFIVCRYFDSGHSYQWEVISHCGFDLHLPNDKRCWTFFHVLIICRSSVGKCVSVFCPLFYCVVCFSNIELYEMLVYFGV